MKIKKYNLYRDDTLQSVIDYFSSKGYHPDDIKFDVEFDTTDSIITYAYSYFYVDTDNLNK